MSQQSGVQTAGASVTRFRIQRFRRTCSAAPRAIGNSLNVITTGSNNTVIVTSKQTNNGDQTANVSINGK